MWSEQEGKRLNGKQEIVTGYETKNHHIVGLVPGGMDGHRGAGFQSGPGEVLPASS